MVDQHTIALIKVSPSSLNVLVGECHHSSDASLPDSCTSTGPSLQTMLTCRGLQGIVACAKSCPDDDSIIARRVAGLLHHAATLSIQAEGRGGGAVLASALASSGSQEATLAWAALLRSTCSLAEVQVSQSTCTTPLMPSCVPVSMALACPSFLSWNSANDFEPACYMCISQPACCSAKSVCLVIDSDA